MKKDSEILQRALDLISDEKHWCRGRFHTTETRWRFGIFPTINHRYCAAGALVEVSPDSHYNDLSILLDDTCQEMFGTYVMGVNDTLKEGWGHEAVVQVYEKTICALQEQGR